MSDTTGDNSQLVEALRNGRWAPQPGHVEPTPMADGNDNLAQMFAQLPAQVPTTPVPDAVASGEAAGDLTPGGPDWTAAPSEPISGAQPPAGGDGAVPQGTGAQAPTTPPHVPIINVTPDELAIGDIVQFAEGPRTLVLQNADVWVASDCTLRYFVNQDAIPVIRPAAS